MKIKDFELEIIKAKPGDTIVIKFPTNKYDVNFIRNIFDTLKNIVPEGAKLMMMPIDWAIEVEN